MTETNQKRDNWIIVACLMVIFLVIMSLIFFKADEVTKNPCSICADRLGEDIYCKAGDVERVYAKNGSVATFGKSNNFIYYNISIP